MAITGVNHITFEVSDLAASLALYGEDLGCVPVARWSTGAYLLAGDT
jgi:catechol 2,3-dioxygenase-like lactoylglutathione lyase family enzyme